MADATSEPARTENPQASRRWRALSWMLVAACVLAFAFESRHRHPQVDDAYIAYRYARNFVEGHGLVFNVGERVEGFTSPAWVLLVATGIALGGAAPDFAHVLGFISGAALLILTYLYARVSLSPSRWPVAALAPWMLLSSRCFGLWSTSGLETALFAALSVGALIAQVKRRSYATTLLLGLATLTRPEGVVLALAVLPLSWREAANAVERWTPMLLYALMVAALTVFRLAYYGAPLPNTFYAKVGGAFVSGGMLYVLAFILQFALPLALPAALVARKRSFVAGSLSILALQVPPFLAGGDFFPHGRLLLPALAVLCAMAAHGVARGISASPRIQTFAWLCVPSTLVWYAWSPLAGAATLAVAGAFAWSWRGSAIRAVGAVVCAATAIAMAMAVWEPLSKHYVGLGLVATRRAAIDRSHNESRGVQLGGRHQSARINMAQPPVRLVAALGIGVIGYHTRASIVDIAGLVDPVVARSYRPASGDSVLAGHQRSNADYVISRKPDYILITPQLLWPLAPVLDILAHPEFHRTYVFDEEMQAYRRKDLPPFRGITRPTRRMPTTQRLQSGGP